MAAKLIDDLVVCAQVLQNAQPVSLYSKIRERTDVSKLAGTVNIFFLGEGAEKKFARKLLFFELKKNRVC